MNHSDLSYPFTVRPFEVEEGGGYLVEFPDLPGCTADGATVDEALSEAADALRSRLGTMRELGRPIPPSSRCLAGASSSSGHPGPRGRAAG
jgi:antitoxin HicB